MTKTVQYENYPRDFTITKIQSMLGQLGTIGIEKISWHYHTMLVFPAKRIEKLKNRSLKFNMHAVVGPCEKTFKIENSVVTERTNVNVAAPHCLMQRTSDFSLFCADVL